ncbi:MAG: hypothetical protein SPK70_03675 [Succinivibrio dextrinosolvens]|nr:hypothetical protein [Succinivibrio dextrinosolvens]
MKIKTTFTFTVEIFKKKNELPTELQNKTVQELEKIFLKDKEKIEEIEGELITLTRFDKAEIKAIKVEEVEE